MMNFPLNLKVQKHQKFYILVLLFSSLTFLKSQVGINTSFPAQALHVDGQKDNTSVSPTNNEFANDVVFTTTGKIGVGVLNPVTRLDTRSTVNTDNSIGIGKTTQTAAEAEAGAMRYNSTNGGKMQFSDGIVWNDFISNPNKATVVARIQAPNFTYKFPYQVAKTVTNWDVTADLTLNFDGTTGVFTAPRTGTYLVSFTYNLVSIPIVSPYLVESQFVVNGSIIAKKCLRAYGETSTASQNGGHCISAIKLTKGDTLEAKINQKVYNGNLSMRSGPTNIDNDFGFNNITIVEQ